MVRFGFHLPLVVCLYIFFKIKWLGYIYQLIYFEAKQYLCVRLVASVRTDNKTELVADIDLLGSDWNGRIFNFRNPWIQGKYMLSGIGNFIIDPISNMIIINY